MYLRSLFFHNGKWETSCISVAISSSGKTSLIKALTEDATMQPKDQLFATLDVTVHGGILPNRMQVIYIDTVGFISALPHTLVASFAATLEDVLLSVSL